jgi:hypothetical protein
MDLPLEVSGSPQEPLSFLNLPHHHTYYKAVREGVGCVFSTAVPITKLFARGGGGMEDMCYERLRAETWCELVCPSRTSERGGADAFAATRPTLLFRPM